MDTNPVWTQDGTHVVFGRGNSLFRKRADGTGNAEELWTNPGGIAFPESWRLENASPPASRNTRSAVISTFRNRAACPLATAAETMTFDNRRELCVCAVFAL